SARRSTSSATCCLTSSTSTMARTTVLRTIRDVRGTRIVQRMVGCSDDDGQGVGLDPHREAARGAQAHAVEPHREGPVEPHLGGGHAALLDARVREVGARAGPGPHPEAVGDAEASVVGLEAAVGGMGAGYGRRSRRAGPMTAAASWSLETTTPSSGSAPG